MKDIKIGTEVTLSKKQIDYCELLAIQKMERHRGLGVEDFIVKAGDNGFDRDFSSIKAQMAITIAAGSNLIVALNQGLLFLERTSLIQYFLMELALQ